MKQIGRDCRRLYDSGIHEFYFLRVVLFSVTSLCTWGQGGGVKNTEFSKGYTHFED